MQLTEAQTQQLIWAFIGLVVVLLLFIGWLFKSFIPRAMEARQRRTDAQASVEIERQRKKFDDELEQRQTMRRMEHEQQQNLFSSMAQLLNSQSEGARNYAALAQKMMDLVGNIAGSLQGNQTVLTGIADTIDDLHNEFQEIKAQILSIATAVQTNTADTTETKQVLRQCMASVQGFDGKLDTFLQQVRQDTGSMKAVE